MILGILQEGLFAGIAAVGFSLISDPPKRLIFFTALLAAIARGFRYTLVGLYSVDIAIATLLASILVGFLGIYMANKLRCPMEVISFPALLPMIPGLYAYRTVVYFVQFSESTSITEKQELLIGIFDYGTKAFSITSALAVGVVIPLLIFYEKSFTMTRAKKG